MWFFNNKKTKLIKEDKVWMHTEAKFYNLIKDLKLLKDKEQTIVVCSFFTDSITYAEQILTKTNVLFNNCSNTAQLMPGQVNLILADELIKKIPAELLAPNQELLDIYMPEHHPLYSVEKDFFMALENRDIKTCCTFYLSLQEPIFKVFGTDNIENMMLKMGMTENEYISHTLISKSIENVQKKTEKNCVSIMNTDSVDEWYKKNTCKNN